MRSEASPCRWSRLAEQAECVPALRSPREIRRPRRRWPPPCARSARPLPDASPLRSAPEDLLQRAQPVGPLRSEPPARGLPSLAPVAVPRGGQVLDGIREIVHAPLQPLPLRQRGAIPPWSSVVRGVAELGPVDDFKVACLQGLRQDYRQHAFDVRSSTMQARPQPGCRVLLDRAGRGELGLHDHRLAERRVDQNIRLLPVPVPGTACWITWVRSAWTVLSFQLGFLRISARAQRTVRLRFRVARAAHAVMARAPDCKPLPLTRFR